MKPTVSTYRPNKSVHYFTVFHHIKVSWKITQQGGVRHSKCLILVGFTGHNKSNSKIRILAGFTGDNKSNCKISIWNKLTLHIA